ncbi:20330_t:CDS:1, partial [Dentiscutata erythropus]
TSTSLEKKKSKTHKSHKVKDTDTPPLVSVPTSKKEKQSLKPLSQDKQSCLEKIIKKIIEE